jgi:hypothetical protein
MPILNELPLKVEIDQVFSAQGVNPALAGTKHPKLFELTEKAIAIGSPILDPQVIYEQYQVSGVQHNRLLLSNGRYLQGELVVNHLASADSIIVAVCTVGEKIGVFVDNLFTQNPALAMAVDGLASAATEVLGNSVCQFIESNLMDEGMQISVPLNPGMLDWPVEEGQPQIFSLLNSSEIGVQLESSGLMTPLKTLSMVVGIGSHFDQKYEQCDLCNLRKTCQHRQARISQDLQANA